MNLWQDELQKIKKKNVVSGTVTEKNTKRQHTEFLLNYKEIRHHKKQEVLYQRLT